MNSLNKRRNTHLNTKMTQTAYREQQSWYLLKLQDQKSYSFWELSRIPFIELEQIALYHMKNRLGQRRFPDNYQSVSKAALSTSIHKIFEINSSFQVK